MPSSTAINAALYAVAAPIAVWRAADFFGLIPADVKAGLERRKAAFKARLWELIKKAAWKLCKYAAIAGVALYVWQYFATEEAAGQEAFAKKVTTMQATLPASYYLQPNGEIRALLWKQCIETRGWAFYLRWSAITGAHAPVVGDFLLKKATGFLATNGMDLEQKALQEARHTCTNDI